MAWKIIVLFLILVALIMADEGNLEINMTASAEEIAKIIERAKMILKEKSKATTEKQSSTKEYCKKHGFYCGRHLHAMGYTKTAPNVLYECGDAKEGIFYSDCSSRGCEGNAGSAYCPCTVGSEYCGWTLRTYNMLIGPENNHVIYKCKGPISVKTLEKCALACHLDDDGGDEASCTYAVPSICTTRKRYCGLELVAQYPNFKAWGPQLMYECSGTKEEPAVKIIKWCKSGCIPEKNGAYCDSGRMALPPGGILKEL